ncbi:hypothetical protein KsCSTR_16020 [Candidatus Kuenenia stuttgartiensis]|uniref:Uncharacterized protein n=1 Tax=Kuenenia stuttgartiensis TaxID=174633 RepID=Q1Q1S7_KUEST|nr:hypothetical protein KsCSTR_16020 [Candidatus Kuenenia stuttgartiensis]CAJ73958.1 unknown protein [Candidatus Kuenenia stuttgartiensis]
MGKEHSRFFVTVCVIGAKQCCKPVPRWRGIKGVELSAEEIWEVYNMNSHKFFFSFLRSAGMHVTKQDKIVHLTSLRSVGKRVKFVFIIKW